MFESIFTSGSVAAASFFIVLGVSLICGVIYAFLSCYKSGSSASFFIATALIPMAVAAVVALVNGNLGVGVAVAGAFGLVRFRSAPGSAKEIAVIFIGMAAGLAFGTGYVAYGAIFIILSGVLLLAFGKLAVKFKKHAKTDNEKTDIPDDLPDNADTLAISCSEGTNNCWSTDGQTLTFSNLTADTVCSVSGEFNGAIVINGGDDYKFEPELCGVTLYSGEQNPVTVLSGDKVTITAKKGTKNYIYDTREDVSTDETAYSSAIYSTADLDIGGKGELIVISSENNGIHAKDDLSVKNLTLSVTCEDNALKGNDSVSITGGILTLIAKTGDGIKTTNTDLSSKGKQRGTVSLSGGTVNIYAACDGIDAAYNAEVSGEAILNIYTDRYSPYSDTVEKTESTRYIRYTSDSYKFSVKYMSGDDYKWVNASLSKTVNGGRTTYYYYAFDKLENYETMQFFIYSSAQEQGQENEYVAKTDNISWNDSYDTFAIQSRGNSLSYNWTNYSTSIGDFGGGSGGGFGGGPGGFGGTPGGMGGNPGGTAGGNTDTGNYSTKGIKADNDVLISGGTITVNSYDDSIHANNDVTL